MAGGLLPRAAGATSGAVTLFRRFGYAADVRLAATQQQAMRAIVESLDAGAPVIALTKAGAHAVLVNGYAVDAAGDLRTLYVVDPLHPEGLALAAATWLSSAGWMRDRFAAAGEAWQGRYVLVIPRYGGGRLNDGSGALVTR